MTVQQITRLRRLTLVPLALFALSITACRSAADRPPPPVCKYVPAAESPPTTNDNLPRQAAAPTTPPPDDPCADLRRLLRFGTPEEKEQALYEFRDGRITDLIPDVIDAIADPTLSPRHGDTGWGFVGHQAAWMLADIAYRLDGLLIENRGRSDYTFFDDMYKGGEALRANGRIQQVQDRWRAWWTGQSAGP